MDRGPKHAIAEEAARIICVEQLIDYRAAKHKAAERLGYPARAALPDNAAVQAAVIEYQRLFGGAEYREHLARMRAGALTAMTLLQPFEPRLVGGAVSGAVTPAHHLQLHVFADPAEAVDMHLLNAGIEFEQDERNFRYPDGRELRIPLVRLERPGLAIDVAIFPVDELARPPVNPLDGRPYRRLDRDEAERLQRAPIDTLDDGGA